MNWIVTQNNHVMPTKDTYDHEEKLTCWCNPTPDEEDESVIVHHSFDERERFELR